LNSQSYVIGVMAVLLNLACGRQAPPGGESERSSSPESEHGEHPVPTATETTAIDNATAADTTKRERGQLRPGAPARADRKPMAVPGEQEPVTLTVKEVTNSSWQAGGLVSVRGTCLRRGAGQAVGAPPLTRSDWELGEDSVAVWVSGPRPPDCTAETGATVSMTVDGVVALDTLRTMDGDRLPRVYLVAHTRH